MTETEKAYIARIIDGEGSIMLQKFHTNEYPSPCVSIASTTLDLLKWIKYTIEKGPIINKKIIILINIKIVIAIFLNIMMQLNSLNLFTLI